MTEITYLEVPRLYLCPESGGLWLDYDVQRTLTELEPGFRFELDTPDSLVSERDSSLAEPTALSSGASPGSLPLPLFRLPNLFYRSALTLVGMYALLVAVLIAAVEFAGVTLEVALGVGVVVAVLQFLLSPFIMDIVLKWLYKAYLVDLNQLPAHLVEFVSSISAKQAIRPPRFFVIDDGAPQAFAYGHTPNNARIAISRGTLELLEPEEV
jgi:Zn-dependent protease with chaperone function